MKVQIKNLKPNPYRDMENYPIKLDKIQHLSNSIKQTGFWDNVIARKSNGEIQIAYGHHRLEALKKVMKPTDEIEVPIKDLTDALMIQIMAKENDNDWQTCVAVTDETVRVAKRFLIEHPEEVKTKNPKPAANIATGGYGYQHSPEALIIAEFLEWGERKVYDSLSRINMILDKELPLSKKVIESVPTEKAASRFVSAVKKSKLSINEQKNVLKKLKEKDSWGDQAIKDAVFDIRVGDKMNIKQEYSEVKVIEFEDLVKEIIIRADEFSNGIKELNNFKDEFDSVFYRNMIKKYILITTMERIKNQIINFLNTYENEKTFKQLSERSI
jgi:hypothetical protein